MSISRVSRSCRILCTALAFPALAAAESDPWQPVDGESLYLQAYDTGGKPVGHMHYRFEREGDTLTVRRDMVLSMSKFFLRADVQQDLQAVWEDDVLAGVESRTLADTTVMDKDDAITITRTDTGELRVQGKDGEHMLPEDAWPATLWHIRFVEQNAFFDLAEGKPAEIAFDDAGMEVITADGGEIRCRRFDVSMSQEDRSGGGAYWYEPNGRLCGQLMEGKLGTIRLVREPVPTAAD